MSTKAYFLPTANPANLAYSAQQLAALYASAIPGGGNGGGGAAGNQQQIPGALSAAAASMQQAPGMFGREGRLKEEFSLLFCMLVVANHELMI